MIDARQLICIDEMGVDYADISRRYGRSLSGEHLQAARPARGQKGVHFTLIIGVCWTGLTIPYLVEGHVDHTVFSNFLEETIVSMHI